MYEVWSYAQYLFHLNLHTLEIQNNDNVRMPLKTIQKPPRYQRYNHISLQTKCTSFFKKKPNPHLDQIHLQQLPIFYPGMEPS